MSKMAGVKNNKNIEPHIPKPFQKGNEIIREYTEDKIVNGTIYRSVLVDYAYPNKKGSMDVEYGYLLRHVTIRTEDSHKTISELNLMSAQEIMEHTQYVLSDDYKYRTKQYLMYLTKYTSRRLAQMIQNLNFYDDIPKEE